MNKSLNTPILIVAFNRPQKVQAVFDRVREVQPKQLFLSVDGARIEKQEEAKKVQAVQYIIKQVDWECDVQTLFHQENLGCRMGVSSGINWFFEQVEQGIILEDDCVPDTSFFYYCEELLEKYKDNDQIMQISGSNLIPDKFAEHKSSYVFSNFGLIWGWATWRRAWQKNDVHLNIFPDFIAQNKAASLVDNTTAQAYITDKFEETYLKNNNSWAYAWFCILLYYNGLSILPTKNLIENIGIDEEATHTVAKGDELKRYQTKSTGLNFPLIHPKSISKIDNDLAMEIFYANYKPKHLLLINKIVPLKALKIFRKLKKKYL
jgi:hypothetical protein